MSENTELSQEEIVFQNVCLDIEMGDYRGYKVGTIGNVIHHLRAYGLNEYDVVQIGQGKVTLYGINIATFTVNEERPIFEFTVAYSHCDHRQKMYLDGLLKFKNPWKQ